MVEFVNDVIKEIPKLEEFDDETKSKHKLIISDDFINLTKKIQKINPFLISGGKFGFTVWLMADEYTSIPEIITQNIEYFLINRIKDNVSTELSEIIIFMELTKMYLRNPIN